MEFFFFHSDIHLVLKTSYIMSFASHTRIVPSEDPVKSFSSMQARQLIALSWPTYCRLKAADFASYALAIPSPQPVNTKGS